MFTVILCVLAPLDQVYAFATVDDKLTVPPGHTVNDPDAEITGVLGNGLTITLTAADTAELQPLASR